VIRGGSLIGGTGAPARTADVAVAEGRVVAVDDRLGAAKRDLDAAGALVLPEFVTSTRTTKDRRPGTPSWRRHHGLASPPW
jgi:N-acyl-D-aspartate/D-glutamate deacylase